MQNFEQIVSVAAAVKTPIGLIGLVVALALIAYAFWLRAERKKLELLPADQRAEYTADRLKKRGYDAGRLNAKTQGEHFKLDMQQRYRLQVLMLVLAAVVFVICFLFARREPPPKEARLAVALTRSNLTENGGTAIAVPAGPFRGADTMAAADAAARWVRDALAEKYPPATTEPLEVRAKVRVDPTGSNHDVRLGPTDELRTDRFWVLGTTDSGKSHHLVGDAREVSREAITKARDAARQGPAPGGPPVQVGHLFLHCDRPGYRLALLEVPVDGREVKESMPRRDPAFTVVVLGGKEKREQDAVRDLVARLQAAGVDAGDETFQQVRRGKYEESRKVGISPAQRFTALIESRIDAFVTVTEYSE